MNTQVPAPGEQPGQTDTTPATQTSEQPSSVDVNDFSADQLLEAITGSPEVKAPTTETNPAPPASEQPPAEETKPNEDATPPKKENAIRLRFSALPADQQQETAEAYRMVRDGEAADMLEAYQKLRGTSASQPAANPPAAKETPAAEKTEETETPSEVQSLQAELADLREQRKAAKKDFDSDLEDDLSTKIEDMTLKLAKAEAKAEALEEFSKKSEAQARQQWNEAYESAVEVLEEQYPAVLDDNHPFTRLLDGKAAAAKASNDPRLANPEYLLEFAKELTEELEALAPKPSGVAPQPPPNTPRPTGSAVAPAKTTPARMTDQQAAAVFYDESTSPDDILAALTAKS